MVVGMRTEPVAAIGTGAVSLGAEFDPADARYRYLLWRLWDASLPPLNVIGLNPSTADATRDDPTIRRCCRFARDWGFGGLLMTNLFAWRAADPRAMMAAPEPVGRLNDGYLMLAAAYPIDLGHDVGRLREAGWVLAAWGTHGEHRGRASEVLAGLRRRGVDACCLGVNRDGSPKHPLYQPSDARPSRYGG